MLIKNIHHNVIVVKKSTSIFCYYIFMNFKERLRSEMEYKGISGKELADKAGISYSTFLSYIDARGTLPNVETAVRLAKILGVTVEYLVNGENVKTSASQFQNNELMYADSSLNNFIKKYEKLSSRDKKLLSTFADSMAKI